MKNIQSTIYSNYPFHKYLHQHELTIYNIQSIITIKDQQSIVNNRQQIIENYQSTSNNSQQTTI